MQLYPPIASLSAKVHKYRYGFGWDQPQIAVDGIVVILFFCLPSVLFFFSLSLTRSLAVLFSLLGRVTFSYMNCKGVRQQRGTIIVLPAYFH